MTSFQLEKPLTKEQHVHCTSIETYSTSLWISLWTITSRFFNKRIS